MTEKNKNNILQFPNIKADIIAEDIMEKINVQEECADLGRFCVDIIQKTLRASDISEYTNMDFNDIESKEYKDMFVILNLLVSMFLRKADHDHLLQDDLNNIYNKLFAIDIAAKHQFNFDDDDFEDEDDFT